MPTADLKIDDIEMQKSPAGDYPAAPNQKISASHVTYASAAA